MGDVVIENAVQGEEPFEEHGTTDVGANAEWRTRSAKIVADEGVDATLPPVDSLLDCKPEGACNRRGSRLW